MKINSLIIKGIDSNTNIKIFEQPKTYEFLDINLITSKGENSRGKTTLLRFLIFALGFKSPLTDGVDKNKFTTIIDFTIKNKIYKVTREDTSVKVVIDEKEVENEGVDYLLKIFMLSNEEELDNILGAFYIDQEKGWTLLNRGRVIGKRHFSIEDLITIVNNLENVMKEKVYLKNLELESQKIKVLKSIKSIKDTTEIKEGKVTINVSKEQEELERIRKKILSIKSYMKSLDDAIEDHRKFFTRLKRLGLKVRIEDRVYSLTDENIIGLDLEDSFVELEKQELENQLELLKRRRNELKERINVKVEMTTTEKLDELIKNISLDKEEYILLQEKEKINSKRKRSKNKEIKVTLSNNIKELWEILRKVLIDLKLPDEYVTPNIILDNKLSGKTGTILHTLTFAYKLSLIVYIRDKYQVKLPFIIDSPRSGEVNKEISNLMISLTQKYLREHQIIISSIYQDYDIEFDKVITLDENGVVGNRNEFILN